jgi:hypothetical protein
MSVDSRKQGISNNVATGPFSIYSAEEMRAFDFLVVALAIVYHRD